MTRLQADGQTRLALARVLLQTRNHCTVAYSGADSGYDSGSTRFRRTTANQCHGKSVPRQINFATARGSSAPRQRELRQIYLTGATICRVCRTVRGRSGDVQKFRIVADECERSFLAVEPSPQPQTSPSAHLELAFLSYIYSLRSPFNPARILHLLVRHVGWCSSSRLRSIQANTGTLPESDLRGEPTSAIHPVDR